MKITSKGFDYKDFLTSGSNFLEKKFVELANQNKLRAERNGSNFIILVPDKFKLEFGRGLDVNEDCHKYYLRLFKSEAYGSTQVRLNFLEAFVGSGEKELERDFKRAIKDGTANGGSGRTLKEEILFVNDSFMNY